MNKENNNCNSLFNMDDDVMGWKFILVIIGFFGFSIIGFVVFVMYLCKGLDFLINFISGVL